eukprot:CAMPEP_0172623644 /NCGR_PEP_ID=MMETSP1068-20121228/130573_1 /TAXON_ID=35684 /ORGANISM="Pseudopedinella elastica, Strain CCMP716" /LENGTH=103 /DNA_ID=CAMNT_0013432293 /DNA_START=134 /DNA_END=441 /DNA_ORIENTATION=-
MSPAQPDSDAEGYMSAEASETEGAGPMQASPHRGGRTAEEQLAEELEGTVVGGYRKIWDGASEAHYFLDESTGGSYWALDEGDGNWMEALDDASGCTYHLHAV